MRERMRVQAENDVAAEAVSPESRMQRYRPSAPRDVDREIAHLQSRETQGYVAAKMGDHKFQHRCRR